MIKGKIQNDDRDWATMSRIELLFDPEEIEEATLKGTLKGRREGKLEGKLEGRLEGEMNTIKAVLRKQLDWSDEKIADLLDVSVGLVAQARQEMSWQDDQKKALQT